MAWTAGRSGVLCLPAVDRNNAQNTCSKAKIINTRAFSVLLAIWKPFKKRWCADPFTGLE